MQDFEKLGLFYLGRSFDTAARKAGEDLILYDSRDLVTHAVCVGMTGSGKTGLCLSLLEEAAIDRIPAIAIDPKGDIANLLLTFPQLRPEDFAPWVDDGEARKAGVSHDEFAAKQAALWKKGLADWGQDGARIQKLRDSAQFRIYTPGSQAGISLSLLKSFAAPSEEVRDDAELLQDRVSTAADSLLGLLGIQGDSTQSREHILLSNILVESWKSGTDLDLPGMIPLIQNPPFARVGVIDLESFFPAKDRFALALKLNNLLASPGFSAWLQGEPIDVDSMLYAPDGTPRISVISIAHLGESERMFVVSLLLNEVLAWVRAQPGTSSLRALLYMDEIFGYFPPVAQPPSKKPLLTLLKQARAYGLGVVLATQNPVDLDYKGLSNAGTWFIGRLQAERDKLRVLDGLEGASAAQSARFDRKQIDSTLSALSPRTFLMHNVHEDHPQVFQVRWALSYLRGPLTRQQVKQLMDPIKAAETPAAKPAAAAAAAGTPAQPAQTASKPAATAAAPVSASRAVEQRPLLPPDVPQTFLPLRGKSPAGASVVYKPMVLGYGEVYYNETKSGVAATEKVAFLASLGDESGVDWGTAARVELTPDDLDSEPTAARFEPPPAVATKSKSYSVWGKSLVDAIYRTETLELWKSPSLDRVSNPSESERDFRRRLQQDAREARDQALDKLRAKYAPKLAGLEEKIRKAEQVVDREAAQARSKSYAGMVRFGTTVLNAVIGRKSVTSAAINKAGTSIKDATEAMKQTGDVNRAKETVEALKRQYEALEAEFRDETSSIERKTDPLTERLETVALKPKKTNITPKLVSLAWAPHWTLTDGTTQPAWS